MSITIIKLNGDISATCCTFLSVARATSLKKRKISGIPKKHKHQWKKVEATYSKDLGLKTVKKRCIICGLTKKV